jgi:hypothetical protein
MIHHRDTRLRKMLWRAGADTEKDFSFAGIPARLREPLMSGGPIPANENHPSTFGGENLHILHNRLSFNPIEN